MYAIVDKKIPTIAKKKLATYAHIIELETENITYPSISGHPDIFICQMPKNLIIAPNLPEKYFKILNEFKIKYILGKNKVNKKYPQTAYYNATVTSKYIIHHKEITDTAILNECYHQKQIHINQGYTRCNLLELAPDFFLTSDYGIAQSLNLNQMKSFYVHPKNISLPGQSHGFIGGCCGKINNQLFILGKLSYLDEYESLKKYLESIKMEIIELHNGPLFDGGSILLV